MLQDEDLAVNLRGFRWGINPTFSHVGAPHLEEQEFEAPQLSLEERAIIAVDDLIDAALQKNAGARIRIIAAMDRDPALEPLIMSALQKFRKDLDGGIVAHFPEGTTMETLKRAEDLWEPEDHPERYLS